MNAPDTARTPTARSRVSEGIRGLIFSGDLTAGSRLTQHQLAKRFQVAQSVVRESLMELEFSGLVESVDNVGTFVSSFDADALLQAYQVREVLEGLSARLACEQVSRADLRELAELAQKIHDTGVAGEGDERGRLDRAFHHRIIRIAGNTFLSRLSESYHVLGMIVQASRPHDVIRDQHLEVIAAMEADDPDRAEQAARRHVAEAGQAVRRQIAEGVFVPKWVSPEHEAGKP